MFFKTGDETKITDISKGDAMEVMSMTDYLNVLKTKAETVVIFVDTDSIDITVKTNANEDKKHHNDPLKFIGKIKHVLTDAIVLEKSDRYEEIAVRMDKIISVRKWTGRE